MRRFHSYGPVDCEEHFCVKREELVNQCIEQLIGNPDKGGHYFTIWVPRQTGKTWLQSAIGRRCVCSPEFPTGNGKVDIHLNCEGKRGIIEVKSFVDAYTLKKDKQDAADYAKSLGLNSVTMAVFLPVEDETVLEKLSDEVTIDNILVHVVAIGWV